MTEVRHPLVAPEGWKFIFIGIIALLFSIRYGWVIFGLLCTIYLFGAYVLFRDPYREIPALPLAVLSPVDGQILELKTLNEGMLKRKTRYIKILIHKSGAYTTRSPTEGKVMSLSDAASGSNVIETGGLWVRTDENDDVVLRMTGAGPLDIYPPIAEIRYGERIGQGERIGVNRLARMAELYLPMNITLEVNLGDKVYAAKSVLAQYAHGTRNVRVLQDVNINIDDDGNEITESNEST